jgi:hypothetical protein
VGTSARSCPQLERRRRVTHRDQPAAPGVANRHVTARIWPPGPLRELLGADERASDAPLPATACEELRYLVVG